MGGVHARNEAAAPPAVIVSEPDRMNLLGLMVASMLERRLVDSAAVRHARALRGGILLDAGGMCVTLGFDSGRVTVSRDAEVAPRAEIRGTLKAFLDAAMGRDRVRNVLGGRLRARGRPDVLWHVLALLRT